MKRSWQIILISAALLLAFGWRVWLLTELPPGLTHDEANHGREALGILDGIFLFYFPLNYGSEPLYSYVVAGFMGLLGESLFALRFVNVVFGTAVLSVTYRWARQAFNVRVALLTSFLMAVSFWPLATSRQALRAGLLPFFFGLAVLFFWQLYAKPRLSNRQRWGVVIGFGLMVGVTLHIYLAARVAWLLFPLFVGYLLLFHRETGRRIWGETAVGLLLSGLLFLPMLLYLRRNPFALTRLDMLDRPLQELASGNLGPVLSNVSDALLAFVWPGRGDHFLAYNIPGRPVFDGITAVFLIVGLLICLWRWRQPSNAFVLLWFGVGIIPSLLTGATANTTRNMAALAVIHILPALGFVGVVDWLKDQRGGVRRWATAVAALWLLFVTWQTSQAYFVQWGRLPEVRGAYQQNLVAALDYAGETAVDAPLLLSTVYPGPAHDPSISLVLTAQKPLETRWMDARYALVIPPADRVEAFIPQSTAPHPFFATLLAPQETVTLHPNDLDPSFTRYEVKKPQLLQLIERGSQAANFNDALVLLHAEWLGQAVSPGDTAELLTVWQVHDPLRVGPLVPPSFTTDVTMFAQVLDEGGAPMAQRDALEAPSWGWQSGDVLVQIQPIVVPETAVPGSYTTIVGFYDRSSEVRTSVLDEAGNVVGDFVAVPSLIVRE